MPHPATTTVSTAAGSFTADIAGPHDGPLVVFLHGYPQSRHTWRSQQPVLAEAGWRSVAFDQRGYSPGVRPDPSDLTNYRVELLVRDVLDVAAAVGAGAAAGPGAGAAATGFHLVGHDWGGAVAWLVADRHPEAIASLTILSRPHPSAFRDALADDADDQRRRSRHHQRFHDPETGALLLADGARRLRRGLVDNGVPEDAVEAYLSVLGSAEALEAALAWYRSAGTVSRLEAGSIRVPTLYLWGDQDQSVGRAAAEATARHVEGDYRFVEVAGGGHFLTDDHPAAVNEALLAHLQAHRR